MRSSNFLQLIAINMSLALVFGLAMSAIGARQYDDRDEIKGLLRKKRAEAQGRTPGPDKSNSSYRRSGRQNRSQQQTWASSGNTSDSTVDAPILGVTLWRLRLSAKDEAVEIKDLIHPPGGELPQEYTPERVEANEELREGQMMRLSIESFRSGYLYVINRPKYKDGTYGDSYLIFPTKRIYEGDNKVEPGKVVRIPAPQDNPSYFELRRSQSREGELHITEELIIIIKQEPFESFIPPPEDRRLLTAASVEALIQKYGASIEYAEMNGGAGQAITVAEVKAAREHTKRLDENDPLPQTVYRLNANPTNPSMVRLELRVTGK
jgi:hypothetical protein